MTAVETPATTTPGLDAAGLVADLRATSDGRSTVARLVRFAFSR